MIRFDRFNPIRFDSFDSFDSYIGFSPSLSKIKIRAKILHETDINNIMFAVDFQIKTYYSIVYIEELKFSI